MQSPLSHGVDSVKVIDEVQVGCADETAQSAKDCSSNCLEDELFGVAHHVCAAHADCMLGIVPEVVAMMVVSMPSHSLLWWPSLTWWSGMVGKVEKF